MPDSYSELVKEWREKARKRKYGGSMGRASSKTLNECADELEEAIEDAQ